MLKKCLVALAAAIAILLVVIALRPADFCYTRSVMISAPPEAVFAQVNDLHRFQTWNPWAEIDPNSKVTFSGPTAGPGAAFAWAGNKDVGEGTMTLTETKPPGFARFRMDFRKPMAATNTAEFTFKPEAGKTKVTWTMYGPNTFMGKAAGLFMDVEKMVGDQFDKGLANLKRLAESPAAP